MGDHRSTLISCSELSKIQENPSWYETHRIIDARWGIVQRDFRADHQTSRIPCSKFFDLMQCRDVDSPYATMLPSMQQFSDYVSELGISNEHHVVVYDDSEKFPMFSAPRVCWMFRAFGHDNVSVLDGGLRRWIQEGHQVAQGVYNDEEDLPRNSIKFTATLRPEFVKDFQFVRENASQANPTTLLECRPFPNPPPIKDGVEDLTGISLPSARLASFTYFMDVEKRQLLPPGEIEKFFSSRNIDLDNAMTSCGGGILASMVAFLIYHATGKHVPIYDGAWSEWSQRSGGLNK